MFKGNEGVVQASVDTLADRPEWRERPQHCRNVMERDNDAERNLLMNGGYCHTHLPDLARQLSGIYAFFLYQQV